MDGVSELEDGAKAIFKDVVVQRCIVHLVRNSIKYVPNKDYKPFTAQLRKIYGTPSLKAAHTEFDRFKQTWSNYPSAVGVWERNFKHVEQLFNYGSAVRKIMYTTNAIENVNSSFRKVTKKSSFPNENAVLKLLYLRIQELYKNGISVPLPARLWSEINCFWTTECSHYLKNMTERFNLIYTKYLTTPHEISINRYSVFVLVR